MSEWISSAWEDDWYDSYNKYATREEAIADGIQQYRDAVNGLASTLYDEFDEDDTPSIFYIGKFYPFVPTIDIDRIIEDVADDAYDECYEGAMGTEFLEWNTLKQEWLDELQKQMQDVFDNWLKKYHLYPTFGNVVSIEEIDAKDYV